MNKKIFLLVGLVSIFLFPDLSRADFCDLPVDDPTFYRISYCETRIHGNSLIEDDIFKAIEAQTGYSTGLIKLILSEGKKLSCTKVNKFLEDVPEVEKPPEIQIACGTNPSLTNLLNVQDNLWIAYNKEKSLLINQKKLEQEFKESEKYWDGNLHNLLGTPFDIMVDLNLVETALFGSQANWTYDVFTFPDKEEEEKEEETLDLAPAGIESEEEEIGEQETPQDTGLIIETETEDIPENCVPNQGSQNAFPSCGNGILEVILGETCDDGNKQAGDGCSPSCVIETTGSGGINQCKDPEAVTFKNFADLAQTESEGVTEGGSGNECPPGTHPKTNISISTAGTGAESSDPAYTQGQGYPGPFIGGTLKEFPESNRPACSVGESEIEVTLITGETKKACVPTEACDDFNKARDFLFGEDWEKDEEKSLVASSIEVLSCVNVIPWDGPQNLYNPNEGCIDCHMRGIAKSLELALQTNVTPMANSMSAFEISNRWGPNLTFDLTTIVKSKIKAANVTPPDWQDAVDRGLKEAEEANTQGEASIEIDESSSAELARQKEEAEQITQAKEEWLKMYGQTNNTAGSVALNQTLIPLFRQMEGIFENIQTSYMSMVSISENLASKEMCKF